MRSMDQENFKFKHVLVRVDFNVPLDEEQNIVDDTRIEESLPTIDQVIDDGGIPIILSHLGRPKGRARRRRWLAPSRSQGPCVPNGRQGPSPLSTKVSLWPYRRSPKQLR